MIRVFTSTILALGLGFVPCIAVAEDLSVAEILKRLQLQREMLSQAETGDLGATRGLKLVPLTADQANAATVTDPAPQVASQPPSAPDVPTGTELATAPAQGVTLTGTLAPRDPNMPLGAGALRDPPLMAISMPTDIEVNLQVNFAFDSASIADTEAETLRKMCQVLDQSDLNLVRIIGHTDSAGPASYNQRLSVLRAREVARYLVSDCGIAPERLETMGMGEQLPLNAGDTRADENRRVEFQALG